MNIDFDKIRENDPPKYTSVDVYCYPEMVVLAFENYFGSVPSSKLTLGEKYHLDFLNGRYVIDKVRNVEALEGLLREQIQKNESKNQGRLINSGVGHKPTYVSKWNSK